MSVQSAKNNGLNDFQLYHCNYIMDREEPNVLSMIEELISGRNEFLSGDFVRRVPFHNRAGLLSRYMTNEIMYLEMINRIHTHNTYLQNAVAGLLTLNISSSRSVFFNPVTISPTQTQINASLQNYPNITSNCAICQDAISSGGCRIRQCGHVYHRTCIENWFSMSVRCPVCRYDIREGNPVNQTFAGEEQMSFQSAAQSEGQQTSE